MKNLGFPLLTVLALALPQLAACDPFGGGGDDGPPVEACTQTYEIDTGASVTHDAGVDAGYYISYAAGGAWHLDWTCDTKLSSIGCEFEGTITADSLTAGTCFECESNDEFSYSPGMVQWVTQTSTGLDGTDFTTAPGATIHLDLTINDLAQPDLVFIPSGGVVASPDCNPMDLAPSTP